MSACAKTDGREGNALVAVLVVVLAVACFLLWGQVKKAESDARERAAAEAEESAAEPPSKFAGVDAVLGDKQPAKAPDRRGEAVATTLSALKAERAKVESAAREAAASKKDREAEVARLRNDIRSAKTRIERLKEEWEEDPSDEEAKQRLYDALVKLRGEKAPEGSGAPQGGMKVEGLETRLERAKAALESARGRADALSRRLAALDSAVATAESQGKDVVDWVRFEEADDAVGTAREHVKGIEGLAESTEGRALDVAAEDEAAKARRDASLEAMLEGL